uniref:Uncharacterized protein n=1 Tax=uncultured microorganism TaxID=358574 RepID=K0J3N9_9ZZZZ|nr:putative uncharacterized protein 6 [uncultured microorganism]
MKPILADYVIARLRRPLPAEYVVRGSTPVLSFGNALDATVATLGLNPSRREFLDRNGRLLSGTARRLETLRSLGVPNLVSVSQSTLRRVINGCNNYFTVNPYRWFDQPESTLQSVGASYYDGSACHLDLVQWATDPTWGKIPNRTIRNRLLKEDAAFLREQLTTGSFRLLLINGRGVVRPFQRMMGISLRPAGSVKSRSVESRMSLGRLPFGTKVIGWSVNVQSSYGVSNALRAALACRVRGLNHDDTIA